MGIVLYAALLWWFVVALLILTAIFSPSSKKSETRSVERESIDRPLDLQPRDFEA